MELVDGLRCYKSSSDSYWQFTEDVQSEAASVLGLLRPIRAEPNQSQLQAAQDLLISIEKWKAMCLQQRMGNASTNSPSAVWSALRGAVEAQSDIDSIRSIMRLKGFGSAEDPETGQRRAKVATAVLRFLMPETWGVVDWRTIAILGCLDRRGGNVDAALEEAKRQKAAELRGLYDIVDENAACDVVRRYRTLRTPSLPAAADIDMALFGLSLQAWPLTK